jgi:2-keto-3-deoxy-L-arabinonate dehydratase
LNARGIEGVLPVIQTPFSDDDSIDLLGLKAAIDWAFQAGADGLGTGMVSEILRLTADERRLLTESMVEATAGRGVVFAAVGAESSRQAQALAIHAEQAGCDAIMAAPPLTTHLPPDRLLDYYRSLAECVQLPLIVQDASGYVGSAIPMEVNLQLLDEFGNHKILFKPEASPIGPACSQLRDASGGAARIFDGSGGILLIDCFRRGLVGTMPGLDLLDAIVALWQALREGREAAIYGIYFPVCALVALQLQAGLDGFLAIEKYLLVKRGIWRSQRRRGPCGWSLDDETRQEVDRLFGILQSSLQHHQQDID